MRNRLKVLRAERDWSQAELAKRLGVSRQTVNAIERGKYDPSLPLAFKMAAVFQQPIESMFYPGEDPAPEPSPLAQPPVRMPA